jgi:hypothetical protein
MPTTVPVSPLTATVALSTVREIGSAVGQTSHIVRRYDDQIGQSFFQRDHVEQIVAVLWGILVGPHFADEPGTLLTQRDNSDAPDSPDPDK